MDASSSAEIIVTRYQFFSKWFAYCHKSIEKCVSLPNNHKISNAILQYIVKNVYYVAQPKCRSLSGCLAYIYTQPNHHHSSLSITPIKLSLKSLLFCYDLSQILYYVAYAMLQK